MPGARLTPSERQQISAELALGFSYTQIARRIGRPTSTISREVARNGGRRCYSAHSAEQATRRRARRSANIQCGSTVGTRDPDVRAVRQFVDRFAELMTATGLPRMPARVLACLLVTESGALTAGELGERLEVSPGAISKAVRFLEVSALVRRERPHGQRREVYCFTGDWALTFARREALFAPWEMGAREGVRIVGTATPAGVRLAEMARFMRHTRDTIRRVQREWR